MLDIRAVVTDLDGTVVDEAKRVSAATLRAASDLNAAGIPLVLATARTPTWVAALTPLVRSVSLAVCCGGAVGWVPATGEILWRDTIPARTVDAVVAVGMVRHADVAIGAYDGTRWRVTEAFARRGPARPGPTEIVDARDIVDGPVAALSVLLDGSLAHAFPGLAAELSASTAYDVSATGMLDIAPPAADKAAGVLRGLAEVGVDPAYALAFGDMSNDLPMFAVCGRSVAVANAHPDVLAAATMVAACVHRDGFARTLVELGVIRTNVRVEPDGVFGCTCP